MEKMLVLRPQVLYMVSDSTLQIHWEDMHNILCQEIVMELAGTDNLLLITAYFIKVALAQVLYPCLEPDFQVGGFFLLAVEWNSLQAMGMGAAETVYSFPRSKTLVFVPQYESCNCKLNSYQEKKNTNMNFNSAICGSILMQKSTKMLQILHRIQLEWVQGVELLWFSWGHSRWYS